MFVDWIHFLALYAITVILIRMGQAHFVDGNLGKVLAFFG